MTMTPTNIEWCTHVWNPITGCTPASEGCQNCYAKAIHTRFNKTPFKNIVFHPERLGAPLRRKKPAVIFVNSMGDLFHEDVPFDHIVRVMKIICESGNHILWPDAPNYYHQFIILTKRPHRMSALFKAMKFNSDIGFNLDDGIPYCTVGRSPLSNLWIGVSAENQQRFDERVPTLCNTPASYRIVSVEPMLGPVNVNDPIMAADMLDWVICGPETGPRARPFNEQWAIDLRNQCREYGIPFFYKANNGNLGGERCRQKPEGLWK